MNGENMTELHIPDIFGESNPKLCEYQKRRDAMVDGICNILVANQCSGDEAMSILKEVQFKLSRCYTFKPKRSE